MRVASLAATLVLMSSVLVLTQDEPQRSPAAPTTPTSGTPGATSSSSPTRPDQDPGTGTAILRGRVIRADTKQPIRRAEIRAWAVGSHTAVTDENGRYEIAKLPAGSYHVGASKGGFVDAQPGGRRFGMGRPITVTDGQVIEKIDFVLTPGSVITGRVVDDTGEPVVRAAVQAIRVSPRARQAQASVTVGASTDDRGEFRLFELAPGDYVVQANAAIDGTVPPTYYPGTPSRADAQRITLKGGDEAAGISFSLIRSRTVTVSGVVRNSDNTPSALAMIVVQERSNDRRSGRSALGTSRLDGSFAIENVGPGRYLVDVRSMANANARSTPVEIAVADRDITGLVLEIGKGVAARGRIRFDIGEPPRDIRRDEVRVFPISPDLDDSVDFSAGTLPGPPRDDWSFELTGLSGRRLLRAGALGRENWTMKSVHVDGVDMTDTPIDFRNGDVDGIEIVLTSRITQIEGHVTNERGVNVAEGTVVAFAPDREKWGHGSRFIQRDALDQNGRFTLRGLPPAGYVIVAVEGLEDSDEVDPEILEQLQPKGTRFTLREGETRTIDLKMAEF